MTQRLLQWRHSMMNQASLSVMKTPWISSLIPPLTGYLTNVVDRRRRGSVTAVDTVRQRRIGLAPNTAAGNGFEDRGQRAFDDSVTAFHFAHGY